MEAHRRPRDAVAALEKRLADALDAAGYDVLNTVRCRKPLQDGLWPKVRDAFVDYFSKIGEY